MGQGHTKESRAESSRVYRRTLAPTNDDGSRSTHPLDGPVSGRSRDALGRSDLGSIFGVGSSSGPTRPSDLYQRRETKQERETRRLERERQARVKERERSTREEHVDGGYLVTLGIYVGPEDFNKKIVRHLQIERRLAPFWRGLQDYSEDWANHQIIAAARGLSIPPADQPDQETSSTQISKYPLTSAMSPSSLPCSLLPSPTSATPTRVSSPFIPRGRTLAAVLGGSARNNSPTSNNANETAPREVNLPHDHCVNGQPLEVFLYKDPIECPICFLQYPKYLNHTRCCDQPICSECFVQIKRPDPHFPEGHSENDAAGPEEEAGMLVSELACCPYCQLPEFGVTYEPPPFRQGLVYELPHALESKNLAMSSSSSLQSPMLGPSASAPEAAHRRRTQSLSANAPGVVTTDKIRPEWATKLQSARAHQARRAAAATALHTAAFLSTHNENRSHRLSRFGRRHTSTTHSAIPTAGLNDTAQSETATSATNSTTGPEPGPRRSSGRIFLGVGTDSSGMSRMEELEETMFMEAVRLSLVSEEERKRKVEKEECKQTRCKGKDERKAAKTSAGGASGPGSANTSTLSLPGLGFGKKAHSPAANALGEPSSVNMRSDTNAPVDRIRQRSGKGKSIDRGLGSRFGGPATDPATGFQASATLVAVRGLEFDKSSGPSECGSEPGQNRVHSPGAEKIVKLENQVANLKVVQNEALENHQISTPEPKGQEEEAVSSPDSANKNNVNVNRHDMLQSDPHDGVHEVKEIIER